MKIEITEENEAWLREKDKDESKTEKEAASFARRILGRYLKSLTTESP